jgi:hypothetical protein
MVSSGGGGSGRAPNQPTPSGPIADYGQSTSFNPGFTNVLGAGWATPDSVDAGLARGPQYASPPPPPPGADGGLGAGGYGRTLLAAMMDKTPAIGADKAMAIQRMMMMPGAQMSGGANIFAPAPLPKPPPGASQADQLLYQLANQNRAPQIGGGQRPMGNAVGAYGGGGGSRSPSRGGYSSSR